MEVLGKRRCPVVELADHQQRIGTDTFAQHDSSLGFIDRRLHLHDIAVGDSQTLSRAVVHNNIAVTCDVVRHFLDELDADVSAP